MFGLFMPTEVKQTAAEVRGFLSANANLCRELVERQALALVHIKDKTVHSIRSDGMKPDQLALILISNVVGRELSTGMHHVYRGSLSMVGSELSSLWSKTVSEMQRRGYYSAEEAAEDMRWIKEQIQNAG